MRNVLILVNEKVNATIDSMKNGSKLDNISNFNNCMLIILSLYLEECVITRQQYLYFKKRLNEYKI